MTSITSNSGQAVTLSRQLVESSQKAAENRQNFDKAVERIDTQAAEAAATEKRIIEESKGQNITISHEVFQGRQSTIEERAAANLRVADIFARELPNKAETANQKLDRLEREILDERPSLDNKSWDFSIDENNQFILSESSDLTESEKSYLSDKLNNSGLNQYFSQLRDTMIEGLEQDRGVEKYSQSIGRYDLAEDNFSDIIFFREFKDQTTLDSFNSGHALSDQLAARADSVYDKAITVYV